MTSTVPRRTQRTRVVVAVATVVVCLGAAYLLASWSARRVSDLHPVWARWGTAPWIIAHQGGDRVWPSSTRVAFRGAAALGVDVLEMDVHVAADGTLVVIHDDTVDRTTDGSGPVVSFTSEELAGLDAADAWVPSPGAAAPWAGRGLGIPRLVEVLRDHPTAALTIEIKPDSADAAQALCATLRAEGRTGDAVVASFHELSTEAFRKACPEVATSATPSEVRTFVILSTLRLAGPYRPPFDALQVPVRQGRIEVVTPAFVAAAKAKNVPVHVWTIDDPAEIERLFAMDVDGVITDRPDVALQVVGRPGPAWALPAYVKR